MEDCERGAEPREPGPWIKLADFGLATQGTKCEGFAGTFSYAAPEAYGSGPHNSKRDIWSVGVVGMQLLMNGNLPNASTRNVHGPAWCGDIMHEAKYKIEFYKALDEQLWGEGLPSVRTFWNDPCLLEIISKIICPLARVLVSFTSHQLSADGSVSSQFFSSSL